MTTIGIDLGTTNSLAAYWNGEQAEIIPNALGKRLTPSVVSVDKDDSILIGEIAKERLITHPSATVAAFKRYMGTEKEYRLGTQTFTPVELSVLVLKQLKEDAEMYLEQAVTEAVISVPAYFNDIQRRSTKQAAEMAGLKVERLISEPTAAAIAYGLHQDKDETQFLVFDLGGGTFDVSILELFDGVMDVKSIAGDNYLGGEDFTAILVEHFLTEHDIQQEQLDMKEASLLYKQAEHGKRSLGIKGQLHMSLIIDGQLYETEVTLDTYEKMVYDLILRLRQPIERALRDASLSPRDLDNVILIGGATRLPIIKTVIAKMFGSLPYATINPDEAVAIGAAIQAALKDKDEALDELILTDVCPYTLGIEVAEHGKAGIEGGYYDPLIERNSPIPISKVERYHTIYDDQKAVKIVIYQGESRRVANNVKLGELQIEVKPRPAGAEGIDVRFTYDTNGILEVEAISVSTGEKKRIVIEKNPGNLSEAEIEESLQRLRALKIHPRERAENRLLVAQAERLYEELTGDARQYLSRLLLHYENILETQDEKQIKEASASMREQLEALEGGMLYR